MRLKPVFLLFLQLLISVVIIYSQPLRPVSVDSLDTNVNVGKNNKNSSNTIIQNSGAIKEKGKDISLWVILNEQLVNFGKKVGSTTPVGRYPDGATPEGLMDMAGNVWEWMFDWYGSDKGQKTLRGGSWFDSAQLCRCASRFNDTPDYRSSDVGFRCVRIIL